MNTFYVMLGKVGSHPQSWGEATIVIIPKPNEPNYSSIKVYQLIVLLNCLVKILEKLMASRIAQMLEAHHLLHPDQTGSRPQCLAINAAMALTHTINTNTGNKWVLLVLFLDLRGTFNNISSMPLLYMIRQLGYR
jgi:hypothetical protein